MPCYPSDILKSGQADLVDTWKRVCSSKFSNAISELFRKEDSYCRIGFAPKFRNVFHELFLLFAFPLTVPLSTPICCLHLGFFFSFKYISQTVNTERDILAVIMTIVSYSNLKKNSSLAT